VKFHCVYRRCASASLRDTSEISQSLDVSEFPVGDHAGGSPCDTISANRQGAEEATSSGCSAL
jgi:hypothetical protein